MRQATAPRRSERMRRCISQQRDLHPISNDQPGFHRQHGLRELGIHGKEQRVRVVAVLRPFIINQEVARTGLDLNANKASIRPQRQYIGAPPVRQWHFVQRRPADDQAKPRDRTAYRQRALWEADLQAGATNQGINLSIASANAASRLVSPLESWVLSTIATWFQTFDQSGW